MRLDRLLAMTIMLLNRTKMSATELSEYFNITPRTVYRDIEALSLAGIPIVAYPGNRGGFGIMENYKLDRQILTFQDMVSILSILKGVNHTFNDKKINTAIEKIRNLVPKSENEKFITQSEQMIVDILPWGVEETQKKKIRLIQNATSQNRLLRFTYFNSQGEKNTRTVEPMTLLFKGYTWYLFGYCRLKKDFRLFRLTRISNPVLQKNFFIRQSRSYKDYEKETAPPKLVELTLCFSPQIRYRIEDFFDIHMIRKKKDGSIIVKTPFPEDEWLYAFLLGFGEHLRLISPIEIKKKLVTKAKAIAAQYN